MKNCNHRDGMSHCTECCDEENSELYAQIAKLIKERDSLKEAISPGRIADLEYYLLVAAKMREKQAVITPKWPNGDPNTPIRMYIALKMLRKWELASFDGGVVVILKDWIDSGMKGPIPFPQSPFFEEWATENGLSNIEGFVGFLIKMEME